MRFDVKGILAALVAPALVALGVFCTGIAAALILAERTNSGLFGVCGPYGDTWSIYAQLALLGLAFIGSPILAMFAFLYLRKRVGTAVAA
jgi:hypothetical protein